MPHLSALNTTLEEVRSMAFRTFKCGILVTEMWHSGYLYIKAPLNKSWFFVTFGGK